MTTLGTRLATNGKGEVITEADVKEAEKIALATNDVQGGGPLVNSRDTDSFQFIITLKSGAKIELFSRDEQYLKTCKQWLTNPSKGWVEVEGYRKSPIINKCLVEVWAHDVCAVEIVECPHFTHTLTPTSLEAISLGRE